jgi:hypothetical protein
MIGIPLPPLSQVNYTLSVDERTTHEQAEEKNPPDVSGSRRCDSVDSVKAMSGSLANEDPASEKARTND